MTIIMNIKEALTHAADKITLHDARHLMAYITKIKYSVTYLHENRPLDEKSYGAFLGAVERRKQGEPLQYILGSWDFMGMPFITDKRALIPRPETELLVEEVLAHIRGLDRPANVLDICTGSGCIAVSIAKLSNAKVTAIDICPDALSLAKENATLHNVKEKIHFLQSDLLNCLEDEKFDIIISNPPYITASELNTLQKEIINHEPQLALNGGEDGMDIYKRLIPQSLKHLTPEGAIFLEIGPVTVKDIMEDTGYGMIRVINDYAGLDRILTAKPLLDLQYTRTT